MHVNSAAVSQSYLKARILNITHCLFKMMRNTMASATIAVVLLGLLLAAPAHSASFAEVRFLQCTVAARRRVCSLLRHVCGPMGPAWCCSRACLPFLAPQDAHMGAHRKLLAVEDGPAKPAWGDKLAEAVATPKGPAGPPGNATGQAVGFGKATGKFAKVTPKGANRG